MHVLNHLDDNQWMHFNGGPLKYLHCKYKNSLLEKETEGVNTGRRKHMANKVGRRDLLGDSRATSIQPLLMPIMLLKTSYQSTWTLAKIDNIFEVFSYKYHGKVRAISKTSFAQHENGSELYLGRLHRRSHGISVKIHAKEHLNLSKESKLMDLFKKNSFQGEKNN